MHKFWHTSHKASTDSVGSITSVTGFHDGYVYKIVNQYDDSVIHLENYRTVPGVPLVTEEDTDSDCQRFKAIRIREGEQGGEFEIQSVHQDPNGPPQVWEYQPEKKILIQNNAAVVHKSPLTIGALPSVGNQGNDLNQLWIAVEKSEGSRVYFIKPKAEDVCLTNMGSGQPINLYPPDPADLMQHWVLEPTDYTE